MDISLTWFHMKTCLRRKDRIPKDKALYVESKNLIIKRNALLSENETESLALPGNMKGNQIFIVLWKTRVKRDISTRYDFITLIMDSPLRQLPEKQTLYIPVHKRNVMILCVPESSWQKIYIHYYSTWTR